VYVADLNAGPGLYPDGMLGSPLIIEQLLHDGHIPHDSYFFEEHPRTQDRLHHALDKAGYCGQIVRGDHHDTVGGHLQKLTMAAASRVGIIYVDGNGERMPVSVIQAILRHPRHDRLDVLLNQPTRAYKRRRAAGLDRASFREDLLALGKARVQFRDFGTNQSWVFALATNWRKPIPFPHFHDLTSKQGQWILQRLDQTHAERQISAQPELPHLWPIALTGNTSPTPDIAPFEPRPLLALMDGASGATSTE